MKLTKLVLVLFVVASVMYAQNEETKNLSLKTFQDSVSYSIGCSVARNLHDPNIKLDFDIVFQAMKDYNNGTRTLTDQEIQKVLTELNQKMNVVKSKQVDSLKEINKVEGEKFLAENKNKEGVKVLPDGLQYKIIASGKGVSPKAMDTVKVHYKGTLIDGKEFDSSYKRNEPTEFPVNRVIKGWTEALQLMHVGDKWELFIPSELAYGPNGAGEMIQPNSTLIFEVELLEIKPEKKSKK